MDTARKKTTADDEVIPDLSDTAPLEPSSMSKRSRLQQTIENNSKRSLVLSLAGIVVILVLLALFGIPLMEKFAELTSRDDTTTAQNEDETVVILPPDLSSDFDATNSAEITLSGTADKGDSVKLYKEGKLVDEVRVKQDNSFTFKGVELREGTNTFKAKTFKGDKESRFSDTITISYRKTAPKLAIDYPSEGQGIGNKDGDRLQIEGTTDPEVSVTINGSMAVVDDKGHFKYIMPIKGGENTIKAVATDDAGNKTELERKFTYNP